MGDQIGCVGENGQHGLVVQFNHELKGARIQEVAHQNRGCVAPQRIGCQPPAAQLGAVNHVIVEEGGRVQVLDDGGQGDVALAVVLAAAGGEQHQRWPQPLAAGLDEVVADFLDQGGSRGQLVGDQAVNRREVILDQGQHRRQRIDACWWPRREVVHRRRCRRTT